MVETAVVEERAEARGRDEFPELLRMFRERAGRSGNALAREVEIDPSYLSRIEHGDREPPRPQVVAALAQALGLSVLDRNRLLLAAGHAPLSLVQLGHWDPALQAVVDVLTDIHLTSDDRDEFRTVVRAIAAHWGRTRQEATGNRQPD
jgi:transcriptional regulator with XRE-family HTH domain